MAVVITTSEVNESLLGDVNSNCCRVPVVARSVSLTYTSLVDCSLVCALIGGVVTAVGTAADDVVMVTPLRGASLLDCEVTSTEPPVAEASADVAVLVTSVTYALVCCSLVAGTISMVVVMAAPDVSNWLLGDVMACSVLPVVARSVSLTYTRLVDSLKRSTVCALLAGAVAMATCDVVVDKLLVDAIVD